jgi:hypothetical protein
VGRREGGGGREGGRVGRREGGRVERGGREEGRKRNGGVDAKREVRKDGEREGKWNEVE